jgi:LysR family transcriptional regulator, nod-box dependent transcriptional activator
MNLNQLDLNQLLTLDALLTEKSVSKTAKRLYLSQSAISHSLKKLQDVFQDKLLFTADGRRMVLTPLGLELEKPVHDVLQQIRKIIAAKAQFDPAVTRQTISISVSDYFIMLFMPELIRRMREEAPNVKLNVMQVDHNHLVELEEGETDLVILPEGYFQNNYPKELLFKETYSCIAWSKNPKIGNSISTEQYFNSKHAVTQFRYVKHIDLILKERGLTRDVGVAVPMFSSLAYVIVGTDLIATVQTGVAKLLAKSLPLKVMPLPFEVQPILEHMIYHPSQEFNQANVWFRELLKSVAANF